MSDQVHNQRLNELLIRLYRSLLQYLGECWPWGMQTADQELVARIVQTQQSEVQYLVDLLAERSWPVDFGSFPTDYTDLHYVALDYLCDFVVKEQEALVDFASQVQTAVAADLDAAKLVSVIVANERGHLLKLREMVQARKNNPAIPPYYVA